MSVVVPFGGRERDAVELADALLTIVLRPDDELIVVDNTAGGSFREVPGIRVVHAADQASSYYARNVGARASSNPWLLFVDSDCRPRPSILDDYFARDVSDRCGIVGGEVEALSDQDGVVARYAKARGHLMQRPHVEGRNPFVVTANALVRRAAFDDVGGFVEGIRTAGDKDFCWRVCAAGWTIEYAPEAVVEHRHRETLRDLAEQWRRYGSGDAWLERRYPGVYPRSSPVRALGGVAKILARAGGDLVRGRREDARFRALDAFVAAAYLVGPLQPNRARVRQDATRA